MTVEFHDACEPVHIAFARLLKFHIYAMEEMTLSVEDKRVELDAWVQRVRDVWLPQYVPTGRLTEVTREAFEEWFDPIRRRLVKIGDDGWLEDFRPDRDAVIFELSNDHWSRDIFVRAARSSFICAWWSGG